MPKIQFKSINSDELFYYSIVKKRGKAWRIPTRFWKPCRNDRRGSDWIDLQGFRNLAGIREAILIGYIYKFLETLLEYLWYL